MVDYAYNQHIHIKVYIYIFVECVLKYNLYDIQGQNGICEVSKLCPGKQDTYDPIVGWQGVNSSNMTALMEALVVGPVSVVLDANSMTFETYSSGVIDSSDCGTDQSGAASHPVLLVGYGMDQASGLKYWKIKNQWGTSWGMNGYALICRDCGKNGNYGECDILQYPPVYPLPKKHRIDV